MIIVDTEISYFTNQPEDEKYLRTGKSLGSGASNVLRLCTWILYKYLQLCKEQSLNWQGKRSACKESQEYRHVAAVIACDVVQGAVELNSVRF
jgi:hypothetical protein